MPNTDTEPAPEEKTMPSTEAPELPKDTPAQSPESKHKAQAEAAELLRRTGERFARHALDNAKRASAPSGALLAAREAVRSANAELPILLAALAATMPVEWLDDHTATWLQGMTKGEAECALAAFAAFWTLGYRRAQAEGK